MIKKITIKIMGSISKSWKKQMRVKLKKKLITWVI